MIAYPPPSPHTPRGPHIALPDRARRDHANRGPHAPDAPTTQPGALDNAEQFARTYEQTFDAVHRYAKLLSHDPHEAEDIVAETYLRAWTKRRSYHRNGPILAWLLSITHNLAMSRARRSATATAAHARRQRIPSAHTSPSAEQRATQTRDTAQLFRAIRRLPPAQQQVIALRFLGGCSNEKTAKTLGKHEDAVRALQYRALKQLRHALDSDGATR